MVKHGYTVTRAGVLYLLCGLSIFENSLYLSARANSEHTTKRAVSVRMAMLMLDKTSERLRSKHVRTLELLQKTVDENVELRSRVSQLQRGAMHLEQGGPSSNRSNELEDEIDRLKAEHCAQLLVAEEATRVRQGELVKTVDGLQTQQQKLQNEVFTLEARLSSVRETLQNERAEWHQERLRIQNENQLLREDVERISCGSNNEQGQHINELSRLQNDLETQRNLHVETELRNDKLQEEVAFLARELIDQKAKRSAHIDQLSAMQQQIYDLHEREAQMLLQLEAALGENADLQTRIAKQNAPTKEFSPSPSVVALQLQYTAVLAQLQHLEDQHTQLLGENRTLQDALAKLQTHHAELTRAKSATGSGFATHVDLKRENFHLRAQVDELKQLQKRFLTSVNKKTMSFPAL